MVILSPFFHCLLMDTYVPCCSAVLNSLPFTIIAKSPALTHDGYLTLMAKEPGLTSLTVKVVLSCSGKLLVCVTTNPFFFQLNFDGINKFKNKSFLSCA